MRMFRNLNLQEIRRNSTSQILNYLMHMFRNAEPLSGGDSEELDITDLAHLGLSRNSGPLFGGDSEELDITDLAPPSVYVPKAEPYLEKIRKNSTSQIHFLTGMGGRAKNGHRRPKGSSCDLGPSQQQ